MSLKLHSAGACLLLSFSQKTFTFGVWCLGSQISVPSRVFALSSIRFHMTGFLAESPQTLHLPIETCKSRVASCVPSSQVKRGVVGLPDPGAGGVVALAQV